MTTRLTVTGIAKAFGATKALVGVDLSVNAGECLALIGENGAGKSTLMKVLTGAHRADGGSMTLDGAPYDPSGPLDARSRGVAIVYQELTLARHLGVAENILLGNQPSRFGIVDRKRQNAIAREALEQLGLGDLDLDRPAGSLPIAQQQLVEIARALTAKPRLLILDEPTSSLTAADVEHLFSVIRRLKTQGVSVIYISHFLEECRAVAEHYAVLRDGASVASGAMADASETDLIRHMVGRDVAEIYPRIPHDIGDTVLELRGIAGEAKPTDATLALRRGEILGLFGLVGSGRSETLRALFGLDRIARGMVLIGGQPQTHRSPRQRLLAGMGLVSEDRKSEGLLLNLPIADNLTLTCLGPFTTAGLINRGRQEASARSLMERMLVKAAGPAQAVGELSGGNQQKVAIGRLLHHGCDILLLDEPTRGIDVGAKAHIYRLIGELAAQGKSVIVVSSYIPELLGICDAIAVMCRGVLSPARPVAEWDSHTILSAAIGAEENAECRMQSAE
ncbi:MAG: sugar ABC transporter ATP-binding protein [Planctomycetes bacterium]|nr:sugar ABC transporter ATP-binding protein [Planctomycetota bacterium]